MYHFFRPMSTHNLFICLLQSLCVLFTAVFHLCPKHKCVFFLKTFDIFKTWLFIKRGSDPDTCTFTSTIQQWQMYCRFSRHDCYSSDFILMIHWPLELMDCFEFCKIIIVKYRFVSASLMLLCSNILWNCFAFLSVRLTKKCLHATWCDWLGFKISFYIESYVLVNHLQTKGKITITINQTYIFKVI